MIRLTAILPLLFLLTSCGTETQTDNITSSQWQLFGYLPENTEYLFYADLNEIMKTKYGEENFISSLPETTAGSWINKFEEATGTGLKKGIKEIIIANTRDDNGIFLVRFENNYEKVKRYFNESPDFQKTANDSIFSLIRKPATRLYFAGDNILIISGREDYINSIVFDKGSRLRANGSFISIIKNIREKNSLWMATDKGAFAAGMFDRIAGKDSKLLSPEILSSINNFSVSAEFNKGAEVESALGCSSAGNAYLLASAVKGAIAMNILSQKNYKLGKIFNKMDVNREGRLIRFHLKLSEKELDDIQQLTKLEKPVNNSKGKLW
jgi:hypothetical protein